MVYFLHLVDLYGKCRYINLPVPWMLWVCNSMDQLHGKMPHYTKYRHYDFRCFSTWTNLYDLLYYPLSVKGELVGGTRNMQIHVLNARGKTLVVNHITFSHHQGLWWFWWAELWYRNPKWKVIKPSGSCQTNDADIMNRTWVFQVSLSWSMKCRDYWLRIWHLGRLLFHSTLILFLGLQVGLPLLWSNDTPIYPRA